MSALDRKYVSPSGNSFVDERRSDPGVVLVCDELSIDQRLSTYEHVAQSILCSDDQCVEVSDV